MFKKSCGLAVLFFLFSNPIFSQFGIGGTQAIKDLKGTELLVVLGYDEAYNMAIRDAMSTFWNFNEYRYIKGTEYKKYCADSKYSFLMLFNIKDWAFFDEQYDDVGIVRGGNCQVGPYEMTAFANMIVMNESYYQAECIRAIQFIQNYLELGLKENLSDDNYIETYGHYNVNHPLLAKKDLVLQEEDMLEDFEDLEKVKEIYSHPVRFGVQSEVDRATLSQEENFVYTKLVYDVHGYKYRCFVEAKNSRILYCIETQNREVILMGKRTLKELDDINHEKKHKKFILGF